MASLEQIRDGIKNTLDDLPDVFVYDTVQEATETPALVPVPSTANFTVAQGKGTDTWTFNLYVMVAITEAELSQDQLDQFVTGAGARSIRQQIFGNRTLGLAGTDAHVAGMSDYGASFETAQIQHVGAVLQLVVHTPGTA